MQKIGIKLFALFFCCCFGVAIASNEQGKETTPPIWGTIQHVVMIILENEDNSSTIKNAYFKSLTQLGGYLSQSYAVSHPSQPNYIAMVAGSTLGVSDNNNHDLGQKHLGDLFRAKNLTWKAYAENLPSVCFKGAASSDNLYRRKHEPFISFTDVSTHPTECAKIVAGPQFFSDLSANQLPTFSLYIPNMNNDGHNTSVAYSANWLQTTFDPYFHNQSLLKNTLFIITYDEGSTSGANNIYTLFIGAGVTAGSTTSTKYTHYDLLRTIEDIFNLGNLGQKDATATDIDGIWQSNVPTGTLTLNNSSSSDAACANGIDTLYVDGTSTGSPFTISKGISTSLTTGSHTLKLTSSVTVTGGICKGTLSQSTVTISKNVTSPVSVVYKFQSTPLVACSITSAKVTSQEDWHQPTLINAFTITANLQGVTVPVDVTGSLVMKNPFQQDFWGDFQMTASYSGNRGSFTGSLWRNTITIQGLITNATPMAVGDNPLSSMTINGIVCH